MTPRSEPLEDKNSRIQRVGHPRLSAFVLPEPLLDFGNEGYHVCPKFGLTLHRPFRAGDSLGVNRGGNVFLGIIGEPDVIDKGLSWFERCQATLSSGGRDPYLAPPFPGFQEAFGVSFSIPETLRIPISGQLVDQIEKETIPVKRIRKGVDLYVEGLRRLKGLDDPRPSTVICALSQKMADLCYLGRTSYLRRSRPKLSPKQKKLIKTLEEHRQEHQSTLGEWEPSLALDESLVDLLESMEVPRDFYRLLKAEGMSFGIPTQVVKEKTFVGGPGVEDDATRAWNLSVALYYKTLGTPWRVRGLEQNTCYVGIAFFRDKTIEAPRLRTAMAQVFTASGEGLVLRGESFEWDPDLGATPHLSKSGAASLIIRALDLYREHALQNPSKLVVHKTSRFWEDELSGFREASEDIPVRDFVAFRRRPSIQSFRLGNEPPLRGTAIRLEKGRHLLYTRGYIPFLGLYPGARVPRPLEILQHVGDSPAHKVCSNILALTKMNWNSAAFCNYLPSTLAFAEKVGDVLGSLPEEVEAQPYYRFYM